ncbi:MAG: hypothetical protein KGN02_03750 [bacterium]|nr:hypothetical protein [bacterium]
MKLVPPHDIVRAVRDELAVPGRYDLDATVRPPHRSWLEIALTWVGDRLRDLEHTVAAHVHIGRGERSLFGDVLVLGSLLVVAYVAARLLAQAEYDRAQRGGAVSLSPARSAHALSVRAGQAAAEGDYARAVRIIFAAAVTLLDLRGVVRDEESATINDLRRRLRERGAAVETPFVEIARAYTSAAYAERPTDAQAWERARTAYGELTRIANA